MNPNTPSMSVVVPVFNEQDWIGRCLDALAGAAARAEWPVEIIVVDDGSTDRTPEVLAQRTGVTVLSQPNRGRFEARRAGLAKASGDRVLLLDSRVIVDTDSLRFLRAQFADNPDRIVWNGHINVASERNPYAGFMAGLVTVPWRRYFANPKLTSFGIEEFDLFPKGTTFFCAPKELLEGSAEAFASLYDDVRLASDDTRMLRWIAERERIHIAPEFAATYHGRDSLRKFAAQSYFRGTTYVDSYLASPGPARNALFAALGLGAAGVGLLAKRPKTTVALGVAGSAAAGTVVRRCGATNAEARAVAGLLPLFATGFGAGVLRGLVLALRARLRRGTAR
ncbi:glycosyltransferase family 2 protein [Amycolatopsis cihanbeyliensis]|nr:glycosyltransferase family 2 protein [Amycolatopsis cihanbeyliensis]